MKTTVILANTVFQIGPFVSLPEFTVFCSFQGTHGCYQIGAELEVPVLLDFPFNPATVMRDIAKSSYTKSIEAAQGSAVRLLPETCVIWSTVPSKLS